MIQAFSLEGYDPQDQTLFLNSTLTTPIIRRYLLPLTIYQLDVQVQFHSYAFFLTPL